MTIWVGNNKWNLEKFLGLHKGGVRRVCAYRAVTRIAIQNFIYHQLPSMYKFHGIEKSIILGREIEDLFLITFLRVTEPLD